MKCAGLSRDANVTKKGTLNSALSLFYPAKLIILVGE